jgi:hypothetical protein
VVVDERPRTPAARRSRSGGTRVATRRIPIVDRTAADAVVGFASIDATGFGEREVVVDLRALGGGEVPASRRRRSR